MNFRTEAQLRQELADAWGQMLAEREGIARLRKDAERYNWLQRRTCGLRDNSGRQYFGFPSMFGLPPVGNVMMGSVGQHLDAAIDAQMVADGAVVLPNVEAKPDAKAAGRSGSA